MSPSWILLVVLCLTIAWNPGLVWGQLPDELEQGCDHRKAIDMPTSGLCLVPVTSAHNWTRAQGMCRLAGGNLYETPWDLQQSNRNLLNCLTSMTDPTLSDLWINSIAKWQSQFRWNNGSLLNQIEYCPQLPPPYNPDDFISQSITISVDYCVFMCFGRSASHVVIYNTVSSSACYCVHGLEDLYRVPCDTKVMPVNNRTHFYIAPTNERPLLRVTESDVIATGEIECGTVDTTTYHNQQLDNHPCAERRAFICNLENSVQCPEAMCFGANCVFQWRGICLRLVDHVLNWYEARSHCNRTGGDLWFMHDLSDMRDLQDNLRPNVSYWIGTSNFELQTNANSASLESFGSNFQRVRCGHLEIIRDISRWQWSNTACDQHKAFLCQFEKDSFEQGEEDLDVVCPWPITVTSRPIVIPPPTVVPVSRDHDFPIAALISGLVALLVLLACLAASCAYCSRRRRLYRLYRKDQVAFVPYAAETTDSVLVAGGHEMENMSQRGGRIRSASSMSETGSQFGQVKPYHHYHNSAYSHTATSETYANHNGAMFSSKSLDRNHMALRDKQGMDMNSSYDERGFVSSYATLPLKGRDYMVLEGQMNIQEDAGRRGSVPGKPEVTLVTDHGDMNFTVNHATSHSHLGSERASLERTLDEIHMTQTMTLPERERVIDTRGSRTSINKY